jgi:hypothetical protein
VPAALQDPKPAPQAEDPAAQAEEVAKRKVAREEREKGAPPAKPADPAGTPPAAPEDPKAQAEEAAKRKAAREEREPAGAAESAGAKPAQSPPTGPGAAPGKPGGTKVDKGAVAKFYMAERSHIVNMASLKRMQEMAQKSGDQQRLAQVAKNREIEEQRYAKALEEAQQKLGKNRYESVRLKFDADREKMRTKIESRQSTGAPGDAPAGAGADAPAQQPKPGDKPGDKPVKDR